MLDSFIRPDAPNPQFKTDDELRYIIDNREKYLPESVEIAVAELQHRSVEFSDEEITVINEDMQARRQLANVREMSRGIFAGSTKNIYVEDPDAYVLYTRQVIRVFAILCSTLFASILMAVNIGKTKNTVGVISVVGFGLFFTTAQIFIASATKMGTPFTFICGIAGAYCLDYFFWSKYIGYNALFKPSTYWIPAIVAVLLVVLLVTATYYAN
jgi:hypothetical protein